MTEGTPEQLAAKAAAAAALVPRVVSIRQAELAMIPSGMLDAVEAMVPMLSRAHQSEWRRATEVWRDNGLVEVVRQQRNMTHAEIDALFILAATL